MANKWYKSGKQVANENKQMVNKGLRPGWLRSAP